MSKQPCNAHLAMAFARGPGRDAWRVDGVWLRGRGEGGGETSARAEGVVGCHGWADEWVRGYQIEQAEYRVCTARLCLTDADILLRTVYYGYPRRARC